LTECIDQENIEYISCPSRGSRTSAGVELLRHLLGEIQASDGRDYWNSEFHKTAYSGLD